MPANPPSTIDSEFYEALPVELIDLYRNNVVVRACFLGFRRGNLTLLDALTVCVRTLADQNEELMDGALRQLQLERPKPIVACQLCGEKFKQSIVLVPKPERDGGV